MMRPRLLARCDHGHRISKATWINCFQKIGCRAEKGEKWSRNAPILNAKRSFSTRAADVYFPLSCEIRPHPATMCLEPSAKESRRTQLFASGFVSAAAQNLRCGSQWRRVCLSRQNINPQLWSNHDER